MDFLNFHFLSESCLILALQILLFLLVFPTS